MVDKSGSLTCDMNNKNKFDIGNGGICSGSSQGVEKYRCVYTLNFTMSSNIQERLKAWQELEI